MIVKRPGKGHPEFRVFKRVEGRYLTVKEPRVDAVNKEYLAGALSYDKAYKALWQIKTDLEAALPSSWHPENMALIEAFFQEEILPKGLKEPRAAYDRLKWAIKQLGPSYLLSTPKVDIQRAISHLNANQRNIACSVYNSLYRYKQINIRLLLPKKQKRAIEYIGEKALESILPHLSLPEHKLFCLTAFATGARRGEVYAMEEADLREDGTHIWLDKQLKRGVRLAPTKNDKVGNAFIVPEHRETVKEWCRLSKDVKERMRRKDEPYLAFKAACLKGLKRDATLHQLRHGYAQEMLERGASLADLRDWMRDRMSTIEDYYLRWVRTSSQMQATLKRFG